MVARAPGRVNLLGEHTDYNEGFVLPAATCQSTYVAAAPGEGRSLRIWSAAFGDRAEFSLDALGPLRGERHWARYLAGVAWALMEAGYEVGGVDAAIVGDLPVGAGVASSAAVEVSFALALLGLIGAKLEGEALARLCQRAENEFVGMHCGILDQASSIFGQDGSAMLLDCRSLELSPIPLGNRDAVFVVCDTAKPRGLVGTEYNARRQQCETAAGLMGLQALRDADPEMVEHHRGVLGDVVYRRARHVVTENARVLAGAEALRAADPVRLGELFCQAHASLRDDYEVSCPELDAMVEIACETEGCYGARLMGAGFGGCAISAVAAEKVASFQDAVVHEYRARTGRAGRTFATTPSQGAGLMSLS